MFRDVNWWLMFAFFVLSVLDVVTSFLCFKYRDSVEMNPLLPLHYGDGRFEMVTKMVLLKLGVCALIFIGYVVYGDTIELFATFLFLDGFISAVVYLNFLVLVRKVPDEEF